MKWMKILLVLLAAGGQSLRAQTEIGSLFTSSAQQLVEEAVKEGLVVIRRCYRLQDTTAATPAYYGWNGAPHFGESYSLAVKTVEGYEVGDMAVHPWRYDARFERYRDSVRLVPVISTSEYRRLEGDSYAPLLLRDTAPAGVVAGRLYRLRDSTGEGFDHDPATGVARGWMVWVVSDSALSVAGTRKLSLVIYRLDITFEAGKSMHEVREAAGNLALKSKVRLGGIYILPRVTGIGQVTFKLAGFLHREGDRWYAIRGTGGPRGEGLTPVRVPTTSKEILNKDEI
jgi:hypothetical protein